MFERDWFFVLSALLASPAVSIAAPAPSDPLQVAKLVSQEAAPAEQFGRTTALSGDTLVVGVPSHDEPGFDGAGALYVYVRDGAGWTPQGQLLAPELSLFGHFGWSVAIDGDTLVAGSPSDETGTPGVPGAAYVFVRSGSTWSLEARLEHPEGAEISGFGDQVAISGDTLVVATPADSAVTSFCGTAQVFVRSGGEWTHEAELVAAEAMPNDAFGYQVGVWGDTAVLTSRLYDASAPFSEEGAAALFVRSGTSWTQEALLMADDTIPNDRFGQAAALGDDLLVVGSWTVDVGGVTNTGAAYVFERSAGEWSQQAKLVPADLAFQDHFGFEVAISGEAVVVSSNADDNAGGIDAGSAYVFSRSGGSWVQHAKLLAADGRPNDLFGTAVAIDGETVVAGSTSADLTAMPDAGAAYVFAVDGLDTWTDLGSGLAGAGGVPAFTGTGTLVAGQPVTLALSNAAPSALAMLFTSFASTPAPFKGGTLVPLPVALMLPLATGPGGALNLGVPAWPAGVPSGLSLYFQYAIQDAGGAFGVALSNALQGDVP